MATRTGINAPANTPINTRPNTPVTRARTLPVLDENELFDLLPARAVQRENRTVFGKTNEYAEDRTAEYRSSLIRMSTIPDTTVPAFPIPSGYHGGVQIAGLDELLFKF